MQVREIDTANKQDKRRFIRLPFDLYRTCPQWVPPMVSQIEQTLDREAHPFYRHSEAAFFYFF